MRSSKPISKLRGICDGCGGDFSIQHALACKKRGLITLRHNEIRDAVGDLASFYWKDIRREPIIREGVPDNQTTTLYADLLIRGVWNSQESAAFDVRVTDTDAESYSGRSTESILRSAEQEKKQKYKDACQERHISFTPLVISVDGVLGAEFNQFLKRLGEGLSLKWERKYSQVKLCLGYEPGSHSRNSGRQAFVSVLQEQNGDAWELKMVHPLHQRVDLYFRQVVLYNRCKIIDCGSIPDICDFLDCH